MNNKQMMTSIITALFAGTILGAWIGPKSACPPCEKGSPCAPCPRCPTPGPQSSECTACPQNQNIPAPAVSSASSSSTLLPPPLLTEDTPKPLETTSLGEITLSWNPVLGARSYYIVIEDENSQIVKTLRTKKQRKSLRDLPIFHKNKNASLHLRLSSVNALGQVGPLGDRWPLKVKRASDLNPPEIRAIRTGR